MEQTSSPRGQAEIAGECSLGDLVTFLLINTTPNLPAVKALG